MSKNFTIKLLLVLVALGPLAGCGDPEGEKIVHVRREPRTLLTEGTALNEEEARRREKKAEESRQNAEASQKVLKAASKLDGAKDGETAMVALGRLKKLGPVAKPYYDKLDRWLKHKDLEVRCAALAAACAIDPQASYRIHKDYLTDEEELVRRRAVALWAEFRADDMKALLPLLDDMDTRVQYETLQALAKGKPDVETLNRIAKSVEDLDGSSAKAALSLLLPRRAEVSAFDQMVEMLLDHQDETTRLRVAEELRQKKIITETIATKAVFTALEDPSESVRRACYEWLKELSPSAPPKFDPDADDESRYQAREGFLDFLKTTKGQWPK